MKALSILQPWAWLIVTGQKDIENRSWSTHVRGRILVHAGKTYTRATHDDYAVSMLPLYGITLPTYEILKAETGAIVGSVEITDCVRHHTSHWKDCGSWGFVLAKPQSNKPIPWRGQLGFFDIDLPELHNRQIVAQRELEWENAMGPEE